jgi:hypothetical protein
MYSFLVLGLVPGTNLQITFRAWINIIALGLSVVCLAYLKRVRRLNNRQTEAVREPIRTSRSHRQA